MRRAREAALALLALAGASLAAAEEIAPGERRSGRDFAAPETRAMQDDDATNPGMLFVLEGEAAWARRAGAANRACADCHGDAAVSMRGVAARFPAFDAGAGRVVDLEQRVNLCRARRQQAPELAWESAELLALTAFLGRQSRGLPVEVSVDGPARPAFELGREIFHRRQGQLDVSCSQCHDANWGKHLAGSVIPQAHPTGYPIYRLEWQGMGSLQRRLRACVGGTRAEPWPYGAAENVALELYLAWRARGMAVETPGVRP